MLSTDTKSHCGCTPEHLRHPSAEQKLDILHRCFEIGEDVECVSKETGYSRTSIYKWRKKYLENGVLNLMPPSKDIMRKKDILLVHNSESEQKSIDDLQKQIHDMQLDIDILKETINILKKDPGADRIKLSNREKTLLVDALKTEYSLQEIFASLHFSRSSYYYQLR